MGTYTLGSKTDYGASTPSYASLFRALFFNRYKNRLQVGPETRCVGIDMNRYVELCYILTFYKSSTIETGFGFFFTG
jgi:hypothetical protein